GIAGTTASGVQVFLEEGAWTKRFHPGWGAVAGITAATLAKHGFKGPRRPYEGKFGLFDTHFHEHAAEVDGNRLVEGLGSTWLLAETAIKPYPVCHFIHGCADAAIEISREIKAADIVAVEALLPEPTLPVVAEPAEKKLTPRTDYEAKFSAQFVIATCLVKGRFGLAELNEAAFVDPELLALTAKVRCKVDPDTAFPAYFSGGLVVTLKDGRRITRHVRVNSGAGERALDAAGVSQKFNACAMMSIDEARAARVREVALSLEQHSARDLGAALRAVGFARPEPRLLILGLVLDTCVAAPEAARRENVAFAHEGLGYVVAADVAAGPLGVCLLAEDLACDAASAHEGGEGFLGGRTARPGAASAPAPLRGLGCLDAVEDDRLSGDAQRVARRGDGAAFDASRIGCIGEGACRDGRGGEARERDGRSVAVKGEACGADRDDAEERQAGPA
ncbi:MAG: MmgE/PrpD family protein, partial [Rhizobiales bacterium]|nr:MmgE/PrpD family protein [Hyphomicrobiales bacterium]